MSSESVTTESRRVNQSNPKQWQQQQRSSSNSTTTGKSPNSNPTAPKPDPLYDQQISASHSHPLLHHSTMSQLPTPQSTWPKMKTQILRNSTSIWQKMVWFIRAPWDSSSVQCLLLFLPWPFSWAILLPLRLYLPLVLPSFFANFSSSAFKLNAFCWVFCLIILRFLSYASCNVCCLGIQESSLHYVAFQVYDI